MPNDAAHRNYWHTSDVVFGVPLLIAIVLGRYIPLSLPRGAFGLILTVGGATLIVVGITLIVLARRELAHRGQPADPGHPTSSVVTTGVFSFSRNPLYLGVACLVIGIGLAFNTPWTLILMLPSLAACHYVLIVPEERYLHAKFGDEYRSYTATVHRWLGRTRTS
jgi:protein-S-isoprenylcysteine O-methyltransferase Ste14